MSVCVACGGPLPEGNTRWCSPVCRRARPELGRRLSPTNRSSRPWARSIAPCFLCGIRADNQAGVAVYRYGLIRSVYNPGPIPRPRRTGRTRHFGNVSLCDDCLRTAIDRKKRAA